MANAVQADYVAGSGDAAFSRIDPRRVDDRWRNGLWAVDTSNNIKDKLWQDIEETARFI